jgi:hypothetical protein
VKSATCHELKPDQILLEPLRRKHRALHCLGCLYIKALNPDANIVVAPFGPLNLETEEEF